jgi:SAM-dependent methyltransferase
MLLAGGAARVIGADLSGDAVGYARTHYGGGGRASFMMANVEALPFSDGGFDLVTCFETIEHVRSPELAARELGRVLKRAGMAFVSSPNGAYFPGGHSGNPFHYTEFRVHELMSLLSPHFTRVQVFGQRLNRTTPGILDYSGAHSSASQGISAKPTLRRRLFSRMPYVLQELIWRAVRGKPYYPGEDEFVLEADQPDRFPVIIAVCRRE